MPIECKESMSEPSPFSSNNGANEAGDFECNICFDLAQDPIVTLCGHLFCWPCLFRWLHHHSQSQECPVCKALVQEEKLVPLYGRGKTATDPRSRPVPGTDIPNRPSGQRPETAPPPPPPPPEQNNFPNLGFGLLGGFIPMATTTFGNMTMSAGFGGFGGLFPGFLNFQLHHGSLDPAMSHGFPFGYAPPTAGNNSRPVQQTMQSQDSLLTGLLLMIGLFVFVTLFWN